MYWAEQIQEIQPACFAAPTCAAHVSTILKAAVRHDCPFAIRSGGHSDVPGANNLAGGLVIDLGSLTEITVSADRKTTRVGPGNRWGAVYAQLDPLGLTVVGGREEQVGVAGLVLGGGLSYFSGQYGFACDNVRNYEIVLADGRIINANPTTNPDLYKALRGGGGNNFGVVTRLDLDTYPYGGLMQGGLVVWADSPAVTTDLLAAFAHFAAAAPSDPLAHAFLSTASLPSGEALWSVGLYYDAPWPAGRARPAIYDPFFTATLNASQVASTVRVTSQTQLAAELGATQPAGQRQQFHTNTFSAGSLPLLADAIAIFRAEAARANAALAARGAPNATAVYALQALSANILARTARRGGNVLGLEVSEAPLALVSMAWPWTDPAVDGIYNGGMQAVIDRTNALAEERGLANPFVYMNYAQVGAPVIEGYGRANGEFLRRVARKYDPRGIMQRLAPGGFKLG